MKRLALLFASLVIGCVHTPPVEYRGTVNVASTELVRINPDVKVVADSEKPMFFVAGAYWLFHDGGWYTAPSVRGRWIAVQKPPVPVAQIDQPYAYTHYRDDHPADRTASIAPAPQPAAQPQQPQPQYQFQNKKMMTFER